MAAARTTVRAAGDVQQLPRFCWSIHEKLVCEAGSSCNESPILLTHAGEIRYAQQLIFTRRVWRHRRYGGCRLPFGGQQICVLSGFCWLTLATVPAISKAIPDPQILQYFLDWNGRCPACTQSKVSIESLWLLILINLSARLLSLIALRPCSILARPLISRLPPLSRTYLASYITLRLFLISGTYFSSPSSSSFSTQSSGFLHSPEQSLTTSFHRRPKITARIYRACPPAPKNPSRPSMCLRIPPPSLSADVTRNRACPTSHLR